ncbi:MAG: NPCBM/NEW2 domain-containing protein [Candidatus Sumerlaeota bacterium]|nr:NPCBM/NEW2 domain-containing protein [Candidatus Sumerlaeota bacterium]
MIKLTTVILTALLLAPLAALHAADIPPAADISSATAPRAAVSPAAPPFKADEPVGGGFDAWARAAFLGEALAKAPALLGLEVRRQDYGEFQKNQSVMKTPLQLGNKHYEHGLGTHSVSEIVVRLDKPAKLFEAEAGIDNNYDTGGKRGSAVFVVEVGAKEAFRSGVRRGSDGPLPLRVELGGAKEFTLRVLDAGDGPNCDQSDWAEAAVTFEDGSRKRLDELPAAIPGLALATTLPFSFTVGGKPSAELLPLWKLTREAFSAEGRQGYRLTYRDAATGLEACCELTLFPEFSAAEWVLRFRNAGAADSPMLEAIKPLDLRIAMPPKREVVFHRSHGSTCKPTDFLPVDEVLADKADAHLAPNGGRSSDGCLPFFNLDWGDGGLVGAIGWSGQWAMNAKRAGTGLTLQAGQQTARLKLRPGESIRTPRILLVRWDGADRLRGHNLFRRLMLARYVPRVGGEVALPPLTQNTWLLWFEPERVNPASRIAKEHPEWVLHAGAGDGLFNLGDPAARQWLTDFISRCITDWGITVLRQDFNIAPLPFWKAADAPDRQGFAEIRYIEGLYAMWDELRQRHPKLTIDNCASGGRRIDIETCSRSYPLWRSDTQCCGKAMPVQDQVQTAGLSLYLPLHAAGVWSFEPYLFRSVATIGASICQDTRKMDEATMQQAKRAVAELKMLRPLWQGDYYPLFNISLDETAWCGWQFHRSDLDKGFAMVFRRQHSPYSVAQAPLRGLDPQAKYTLQYVDAGRSEVLTGAQLQTWQAAIDAPATSLLVVYERKHE